MKSSQANKIKSIKGCAHRANSFKHLSLYFSSIVIEGARAKLAIFLIVY